jgi:aldose 1-epimerase
MQFFRLFAASSALAATAFGQNYSTPPSHSNPPYSIPPTNGTGTDGKYVLSAEGIRAAFIPYGASITNLWITDKSGVERDIVLGFDNAWEYSVDKFHPHLGGVPGT